jgi:TPR repeat protein
VRFLLIFLMEMNMTYIKTLIACCVFFCAPVFAGDLEDGIKFHEGKAYAKAAAAFQRAGAQGNAEAQRRLGFMYYHGQGVAQDNQRAVALFEKAATAGDSESARNLGTMYEHVYRPDTWVTVVRGHG